MKINAIKNVVARRYQLKSNPIKQTTNVQKDTFELSFGAKRPKHSSEFLELTKDNKDLRAYLTYTCMLDENDEFSEDYEKSFVEYAKNNKTVDSYSLIITALAQKQAKIQGDMEYTPFYCGLAEALKRKGVKKEDIKTLLSFRRFDIDMPKAVLYLDEIFKQELPMQEKIMFIDRYCKDTNGSSDSLIMMNFISLLAALEISDMDMADLFYSLTLDFDIKFNNDKCKFMTQSVEALMNYCLQNDKVAQAFIQQSPIEAKTSIYLSLKALVESNEAQYGNFNPEKAKESFDSWFEYVKNNKDLIDKNQKITLYDENRDVIRVISVKEAVEKHNCNPVKYFNTLYRLSSVLANFTGVEEVQ